MLTADARELHCISDAIEEIISRDEANQYSTREKVIICELGKAGCCMELAKALLLDLKSPPKLPDLHHND